MAVDRENFDLRKKPTLRELVMFGVAFIVMFAGFVEGLWVPLKRNIKKIEADAEVLVQQQEGVQKLLQTIAQEVEERQRNERMLEKQSADDRIQKKLDYKPGEHAEEITAAVSLLSDRRLVRRMTIKEVNVSKALAHEQYSTVPIEMKIEARYGSLISYLQKLEEIERPLVVSAIDITADEASGFLVAKMNIELYLSQ